MYQARMGLCEPFAFYLNRPLLSSQRPPRRDVAEYLRVTRKSPELHEDSFSYSEHSKLHRIALDNVVGGCKDRLRRAILGDRLHPGDRQAPRAGVGLELPSVAHPPRTRRRDGDGTSRDSEQS